VELSIFATESKTTMKSWKENLAPIVILVLTAALYRAMPGRVWGFAPHLAMAVFGGSVIRDKRIAIAMPILSLILSDAVYHVLYLNGIFGIPGFYSGQVSNYALIGSLAVIGFFVRRDSLSQVLAGSLTAPIVYFLASNAMVWMGGGGLGRPRTFTGLLQCYADGLPYLQTSVAGTLFFSALLFGGFHLFSAHGGHKAVA
jgi:hypothetical protein